ncbi:MAG: hypothetical protein ACKVOX_00310 [Rhizobacter sp.]
MRRDVVNERLGFGGLLGCGLGHGGLLLNASEKVPADDGGWRHERITLWPDSDRPGFDPIVINISDNQDSFTVVAEMLMVLEGEQLPGA